MFEKFLSGDWRNFQQRYLNTYGFFRNEGKRFLVKLIAIEPGYALFINKDHVEFRLNPDTEKDIGFEFIPPKSGWHNTVTGGVLLKRIAQRQWSRGICSKNTTIFTPIGHKFEVNFDKLEAIYNNKLSFEDALKDFNKQNGAVKTTSFLALSPQMALTWTSNKMYCFETIIAEYKRNDNGSFSVKPNVKGLWEQEIRDAFTRNKLQVEVE